MVIPHSRPCPEHGAGLVQIGALDKRLTAARGLTASLAETLRVELRKRKRKRQFILHNYLYPVPIENWSFFFGRAAEF